MDSPSEEKSVVLGLIGYGTVGQGFVRLLRKEADLLGRRLGFPLFLKTIADRNIKQKSSGLLDGVLLSHDPTAVINDPEVQIVIELIGGIEPAKSLL
ncbi:MAG: homoserine dehydrogenase, partial [Nitrospirae bacterium]|nr:homoserine dehydrogenase [Nitrospirota bacterium]